MKKVVLTFVLVLVATAIYAQGNTPQTLKYVTTGPDGSVAVTITDDSSKDNMKLESVQNFYKYQILDPKTSEPVYSASNRGKACEIDKTKLAAGTYNIKLFTSNFVITSKLTVSASRKLRDAVENSNAIAMTSND